MAATTPAARHAEIFGRFLSGLADQSRRGAMARHDAQTTLRHADPLLALVCEIEAHADQRIFANDCANSRLTTIRRLAREALKNMTGAETNPIFPVNGESATDRWAKVEAKIASGT